MFEDGEEGEGEESVVETPEEEVEETPEGEVEDEKGKTGTEAADPEAGKPTLADLLTGEGAPEWLGEMVEIAEREGKPFELTPEEMRSLDPKAQKLVANIILAGKQGAEGAGKAQQALAEREAQVAARERMLLAKQADLLKTFSNPKLKAFMDKIKPTGDRPDPESPEGRDFLIREGVHKLLGEFFGSLSEVEQEAEKARSEAEKAHQQSQVDKANEAYIDQHLDAFRDPAIFARIQEHYQKGYPLDRAHRIAMAELLAEEEAKGGELEKRALEQSRRRVQPGRRAASAIPATPKNLSVEERNAFWEKHPEAMKRDLGEMKRRLGAG